MSNSDSGAGASTSTTPSGTRKHHCRSKRNKLITVIDHTMTFKPKYAAKQPHPEAPMITRPCTECGKKFWSWKALFGHMRCHPERQWRGINPPHNLQRQPPPEKQKPEFMTPEDHEIAAGLLLLANSEGAGASRFEGSSCKRVFGSRQALGGHRANHKNVKGCFANEEDDEMEGHKCGICQRVFPSGQALGGHMRCHWDKGEPGHHQAYGLDLNFPPPLQPDSPSPLTLDLRLGL